MSKVIAFVNQKGGVAKTTSCRTLAQIFSDRGYKCLLLDLDPQQTLSLSLGAVKNRFDEVTPSMYHVLRDEISISDAIIRLDKFDIIRSDYRMYSYNGTPLISTEQAISLANDPANMHKLVLDNLQKQQNPSTDDRHKLQRKLDEIKNNYDFIIIDTNPDLGFLTTLSLLSSPETNVLIPAFAEDSSRESIIALNNTIQTILANDLSQKINILGIFISRYENNNLSKKYLTYLDKLAKSMNTSLFKTKIPKSIVASEAMALKQSIYDLRKKGSILDEYQHFCDEVLERLQMRGYNNG